MLELRHAYKRYQLGDNIVQALDDVSVTIEQGDFVAIMGPSGSGKSTLLQVLGLLDVPEQGNYLINGREVATLKEDELAVIRREVIGFIFQQFNLLPRMTALENVALPLLYSEGKYDFERAAGLLEQVGLGSRMLHHPNELSGGQQQRVAIARSLINRPLMILADEPTGNLDSKSQHEILEVLKQLNASGITIIMVTHEDEIAHIAKRVIRMRDGKIISDERSGPVSPGQKQTQAVVTAPGTGFQLQHVLQHFYQGIRSLAANKVRTGLSMLGILIGVAAVVTMVALGKGAQNAITEQLASLGTNLLTLRSGAVRGVGGAMVQSGVTTRITFEDVQAISEKIDDVSRAAPNVSGRGQVAYEDKNWNTSVLGVSSVYARMHADMPVVGRFFTDDENQRRLRVAVIGATIVRQLFNDRNPIGEVIKINRISFQVIGILPEKGANAFQDQDDRILIPVSTAMRRVYGKDYVDFVDVEVSSPEKTNDVQQQVIQLMLDRHRVPLAQRQDAFQVRNLADIQAAMSASTQIMTLLLSVISAISLLVGGIGIMNIMLVSVTERTREIGLRKAVGARRSDILSQFLVESVVISGVGGSIGILLAWLATILLSTFAGWATTITTASVLLSFVFSAAVGIIFGLYPARKASLLAPIDALRHE